jgi:drug/metabolite transporter (DMT)-like permease
VSGAIASGSLARGAWLLLGSELMFASMATVIKSLSTELPNEMIVFFRNAFGLLVLMPLVLRFRVRNLRTSVPHLHLLRALAGVSAMYCFFYAIAHLPLAEATLLKLSSPFFIPVVAWLWLREGVPPAARWAVLVGFVGVAVVLEPGRGVLEAAALIGLLGGALAAVAKVTVRRLSRTEPATRIVFYFGIVASLISAVPLLWAWQTPEPEQWLRLGLLGLFATAGQLMLTTALASAPAARIGPLTYSSVVFAAAYGWAFWNEVPGLNTWLGAALIAGAGVLTLQSRIGRAAAGDRVDA